MNYKPEDLVVIPRSVLENVSQNKEYTTKILSQAKPLAPLLEDAFESSGEFHIKQYLHVKYTNKDFEQDKQQYLQKEIEL